MIPIETYIEQGKALIDGKKEIARVGPVLATALDLIGFAGGIVVIGALQSWWGTAIGLFLVLFGGWGIFRRLYHLVYQGILRALELVVDEEVIDK